MFLRPLLPAASLPLAFGLTAAASATAQPTSHPDAQGPYEGAAPTSAIFRRPYGQMDFAVGLLTLPDANVCVAGSATCRQGDASLVVSAWPLYRAAERFAVGAGLSMTLTTSGAPPTNDPPGIPRDHSRRYLKVEGTGRYYPWLGDNFETWIGLVSGLVVVRDGFTVLFDGPENAYLGPTSVTIATEGLSLSGAMGGGFSITTDLSIGAQLLFGAWFLPENPESSNLGDTASLAGQVGVLDVSATLTYRVR